VSTKPGELQSSYHSTLGESYGQESKPTLWWRRNRTTSYHVDYVWLPAAWAPSISSVFVGDHTDWGSLSDHAPLVVDIEL